jgi:hypothetical protein
MQRELAAFPGPAANLAAKAAEILHIASIFLAAGLHRRGVFY